jgi:hypothetical protein
MREEIYDRYKLNGYDSPPNFIIADALKHWSRLDPGFKSEIIRLEEELGKKLAEISKN